jgi:hypothetical protein
MEGDIMKRSVFVIFGAAVLLAAFSSPAEAGVQIRLGSFMPEGDSDFWDETEEVFTLDVSDFDDVVLGFTYVHPISNNVEIGLNIDFFQEDSRSAYRDYVDEFDFPIFHDTELSMAPLTVDVRFLPGGRYRLRPGGRQITKPVFYIGGGVGLNFWEYEEVGDFLDFTFEPPVIFYDRFVDDGVAFEIHALAGVEIPLSRTTNLLFEGRYSVSDDDLGGDFSDLLSNEIDLGGTAIYGGLSFQF